MASGDVASARHMRRTTEHVVQNPEGQDRQLHGRFSNFNLDHAIITANMYSILAFSKWLASTLARDANCPTLLPAPSRGMALQHANSPV
jgi:hypothetical protein